VAHLSGTHAAAAPLHERKADLQVLGCELDLLEVLLLGKRTASLQPLQWSSFATWKIRTAFV
jgi:hypothetical protein